MDALGEIKSDGAIEALKDILNDEDWILRLRVAKALGKIGSEKAIELLIYILKDKDFMVSFQAEDELKI